MMLGVERALPEAVGESNRRNVELLSCHIRLKRAGAWWYEVDSNQLVALRCTKYNGAVEQVFARSRRRQQDMRTERMLSMVGRL